MSTVAERNARLDALQTAVSQYATAQRDTLNKQVARCKAILQGRTGSERLAQSAVQQGTTLAVQQINEFLTG